MTITGMQIARAISQNAHPAGKRNLSRIHYPLTNSVGLIPSQTIVRESHGGQIIHVLHNHGALHFPKLNCTACL